MERELIEVVSSNEFYEIRNEKWRHGNGEDWTVMTNQYYTPSGDWIGDSKTAKWLCDERGIKPEKTNPDHCVCSIGFCDKEQKWYGWSHRAIFGFGIGSSVKKGDCAYTPATAEELYADLTTGKRYASTGTEWSDDPNEVPDIITRSDAHLYTKVENGVRYEIKTTKFQEAEIQPEQPQLEDTACECGEHCCIASTKTAVGEDTWYDGKFGKWVPSESEFHIYEIGKGEWTATTLEEAKQMAIDFANSVS